MVAVLVGVAVVRSLTAHSNLTIRNSARAVVILSGVALSLWLSQYVRSLWDFLGIAVLWVVGRSILWSE